MDVHLKCMRLSEVPDIPPIMVSQWLRVIRPIMGGFIRSELVMTCDLGF
jgi:hypothetical protein